MKSWEDINVKGGSIGYQWTSRGNRFVLRLGDSEFYQYSASNKITQREVNQWVKESRALIAENEALRAERLQWLQNSSDHIARSYRTRQEGAGGSDVGD